MPTDVWARAKCSLCHVCSTTKIIKFSRAQAKRRKMHGKIVDLYRCVQTLLRPSDRPNDSKRTLLRELGTSTVRFTVHGKMLTMSIDNLWSKLVSSLHTAAEITLGIARRARPKCSEFKPRGNRSLQTTERPPCSDMC